MQPALGRLLTPGDDVTPGAHPVVVIAYDFWQTRFGGRPDVIGREIRLNGHVFTIVGVAPAGFPGPQLGSVRQIYVPMMMQAVARPPRARYSGEQNPDLLQHATNSWIFGVGRLKADVTIERAARRARSRAGGVLPDAGEAAAGGRASARHPPVRGRPGPRPAAAAALGGAPAGRCGRHGAADRVRQHRQPAALPGGGTPPRAGRAPRAGSEPRPAAAAAPDRERAAVADRRPRRRDPRLGLAPGVRCGAAARRRAAPAARLRDGSPCPRVRACCSPA